MAGVVPLIIFIMSSLSSNEANQLKTKLPKVARNGQEDAFKPVCIAGEFTRGQNCERCFCSNKGFNICTVPLTCSIDVKEPSWDELIHIFNPTANLSRLTQVHEVSDKCEPGGAYRMDCNRCICTSTQSLMCEKLLCPSYDDVNKDLAKEMSGSPCKTGDRVNEECIQCRCKNGTFACDFKRNCSPVKMLNAKSNPVHTLGGGKKCVPGQKYSRPGKSRCTCTPKGTLLCRKPLRPFEPEFLDPSSGKKCTPGVFYAKNCNRCMCTKERQLRCTSMTCLGKKRGRLHKRRPHRALLEKTVRPPKRVNGTKLLDSMFAGERRRT